EGRAGSTGAILSCRPEQLARPAPFCLGSRSRRSGRRQSILTRATPGCWTLPPVQEERFQSSRGRDRRDRAWAKRPEPIASRPAARRSVKGTSSALLHCAKRKAFRFSRKALRLDRKALFLKRKAFLFDRKALRLDRKAFFLKRKAFRFGRKALCLGRKAFCLARKAIAPSSPPFGRRRSSCEPTGHPEGALATEGSGRRKGPPAQILRLVPRLRMTAGTPQAGLTK